METIKMPVRKASLVAEFVFGVTLLLIVASLAYLLLFSWISERAFKERLQREGLALARTVAAGSGYYIDFRLEANLHDIARSLLTNPSVDYAEFLDNAASVLAQSDPSRRPSWLVKGEHAPDGEFLFAVPVADTPSDAAILDRLGIGSLAALHAATAESLQSAGLSGADAENFRKNAVAGTLRVVMNSRGWLEIRKTIWQEGIVLTLIVILVGVLLIFGVTRIMISPLTAIARTAGKMASGDLTRRIRTRHRNEVGLLASSFNTMAEGLAGIASRIHSGQGRVREAAEQIRSDNTAVAERAQLQNAIVDQASGSIEKFDADSRGIAERMEGLSASSEETGSSILEMAASLEEVSRHMDGLHASVEEISAAAVEMAQSVSAIDVSVETVGSFAAETAASMTEIDASIRQVRENARQSAALSEGAARDAEGGQGAVLQTISAMTTLQEAVRAGTSRMAALDERSREIGKILSMIEEVAGETHLLALNAAILAAQAGEEGKGFAVVASEIRGLSERASAGASEISSLLGAVQREVAAVSESMKESQRRAEDGVARSRDAGDRLNKILEASRRASGAVAEIARATAEQGDGSHRVAAAVERVREQITQVAAATSQQKAGAEHIENTLIAMRERSSSIKGALREQKNAGDSIAQAAESTLSRIREVVEFTERQRTESARMVEMISNVRRQSAENSRSATAVGMAVRDLLAEIEALNREIGRFRYEGEAV